MSLFIYRSSPFWGVLFLIIALPNVLLANTDAWDRWSKSDPAFNQTIDHTPMSNILQAITVKDKSIAYVALQGGSLAYIDAYIEFLEKIPVSRLNKNEQLAYWLNLHNAGLIRSLAEDSKLTKKIKKHRGKPGMPGDLWSRKIFTVEDHDLSLEDIEQNILIRHWQDPLVIYGLSYGVKGSPVIGRKAFTGPRVKSQLTTLARHFINSDKNVKVKRKGIQLSSLYVWNKESLFGNDDANVIEHLKTYAGSKLGKKLASASEISKDRFNWGSVAYQPRQRSVGTGFGGGGGFRGGGS